MSRLIRMSPPNKNQRQRLLVNCGISKDLAEPIANATEGFNYAQLSDLARNIVLYQFTYETISSEVCMNMINTQSPVQAVDEYDGFNAEKISLYKKIEELIDLAPQLVEKLGTLTFRSAPVVVNESKSKPEYQTENIQNIEQQRQGMEQQQEKRAQQIEEESKTIPISGLITDVFGEERAQEILQQANRLR